MTAAQKLQYKQDRAAAITAAAAILEKAKNEKRTITEQESGEYDAFYATASSINRQMEAEEKQEHLDAVLNRSMAQRERDERENPTRATERRAFESLLRHGIGDVPDELRSHIYQANRNALDFGASEKRAAQSSVTGNLGGYTVPEGFINSVLEAKLPYGGVLEAGPNIIRTTQGNPLPWPTNNDTAVKGVILPENSPESTQAISFDTLSLGAYKYSSRIVLVPIELLQDTGIDLEGFIVKKLAERLGRIQNEHFTTGTGTNQPQGVVTGATAGKIGASATAITYPELVDLKYSVNRFYRRNGKYMCADLTLGALLKLVDNNGRPLMLDHIRTLQDSGREMILGQDVIVNDDMATMAASAKSILYGDFQNYTIRQVRSMMLMRLTERYAEAGQVAFLAFERMDGKVTDAGTHPIKYFRNA